MGFKSSIVNPGIWLFTAVNPCGEKYYVYVLYYADYILGMIMNAIGLIL